MKVKFRHILQKFDELEYSEVELCKSLYTLEGEDIFITGGPPPKTQAGMILMNRLEKIRKAKREMLDMPCELTTVDFLGAF